MPRSWSLQIRKRNENSETSAPREKMEKAATLVMLQLPTPARESTTWMHVPSQPLMRALLSQFQPRRTSRNAVDFFGLGDCLESPRAISRSVYFKRLRLAPLFSTVDLENLDVGYALAASSCEEAHSVEACTVAALQRSLLSQFLTSADASQRCRFFRVGRLRQVALLNRSLSLLQATPYLVPLFSAVDESHPNLGLRNVNAQGVCIRIILALAEPLSATTSKQ